VIEVTATPEASGWTCHVNVEDAGRTVSEHTVRATTLDLESLSPGARVEDLVRRSFEFLLERESPQTILRTFTLADISRYFPEYASVIRRK